MFEAVAISRAKSEEGDAVWEAVGDAIVSEPCGEHDTVDDTGMARAGRVCGGSGVCLACRAAALGWRSAGERGTRARAWGRAFSMCPSLDL